MSAVHCVQCRLRPMSTVSDVRLPLLSESARCCPLSPLSVPHHRQQRAPQSQSQRSTAPVSPAAPATVSEPPRTAPPPPSRPDLSACDPRSRPALGHHDHVIPPPADLIPGLSARGAAANKARLSPAAYLARRRQLSAPRARRHCLRVAQGHKIPRAGGRLLPVCGSRPRCAPCG